MELFLNYVSDTHKGTKKDINKDSIFILDRSDYVLFIVFDGISSTPNAVSAINKVKYFIDQNDGLFLGTRKPDLSSLMLKANEFLLNSNVKDGATTYALVYVDKKEKLVEVSNLGDTRVYLVQKQFLEQITKDHNPASASNVVTKYLGMLKYTQADFKSLQLKIEDHQRLLICSDGFYEVMEKEPSKMHRALNFKKLGNLKNFLQKEIVQNNQDDASYIVINLNYV